MKLQCKCNKYQQNCISGIITDRERKSSSCKLMQLFLLLLPHQQQQEQQQPSIDIVTAFAVSLPSKFSTSATAVSSRFSKLATDFVNFWKCRQQMGGGGGKKKLTTLLFILRIIEWIQVCYFLWRTCTMMKMIIERINNNAQLRNQYWNLPL